MQTSPQTQKGLFCNFQHWHYRHLAYYRCRIILFAKTKSKKCKTLSQSHKTTKHSATRTCFKLGSSVQQSCITQSSIHLHCSQEYPSGREFEGRTWQMTGRFRSRPDPIAWNAPEEKSDTCRSGLMQSTHDHQIRVKNPLRVSTTPKKVTTVSPRVAAMKSLLSRTCRKKIYKTGCLVTPATHHEKKLICLIFHAESTEVKLLASSSIIQVV